MRILMHISCFMLVMALPAFCDNLEKSKSRYKRAPKTDTSKSSFTADERQAIADKHNTLRRIPSATNMRKMEWSTTLENVATSFVANCVFEHNNNRQSEAAMFSSVGENIHAQTNTYDEEASIQSWYDEVNDYTYSSNTCSAVCGHYTQVVWATTDKVGCGIKFCPSLTVPGNPPMMNAYFVVCNYATSGNFMGQSPYAFGAACSACPSELPSCDNGLCSASVETSTTSGGGPTTGSTPATSRTTPASETTSDADNGGSCLTSSWTVWTMTIYFTLQWFTPMFVHH